MASMLQTLLQSSGIYSVCSAHPWVLQAAALQAKEDNAPLLIEATSNQVNQFGGYTGMQPADFRTLAQQIAADAGYGTDKLSKLILGGDHLGPNPWRKEAAIAAMTKAEIMVDGYVRAGFTKIHLDASMALGGDPTTLSDEIVATRAVALCRVAERAAADAGTAPVYVIGTEVPVPGGADHALAHIAVTSTAAAERTLQAHREAFAHAGLQAAWSRVAGLVVQPGVEFDHDSVVHYTRADTRALTDWLAGQREEIAFEAHSTDYQLPQAYGDLIADGFRILKVGPALTFAMREALYALADIEALITPASECSNLAAIVERTMLADPEAWQPYYHGSPQHQALLRVYSYSDRIRYYWHHPAIAAAVDGMLHNLRARVIPESLLSRYLPLQYARVRENELAAEPIAWIVDKVRDVLRMYAAATCA